MPFTRDSFENWVKDKDSDFLKSSESVNQYQKYMADNGVPEETVQAFGESNSVYDAAQFQNMTADDDVIEGFASYVQSQFDSPEEMKRQKNSKGQLKVLINRLDNESKTLVKSLLDERKGSPDEITDIDGLARLMERRRKERADSFLNVKKPPEAIQEEDNSLLDKAKGAYDSVKETVSEFGTGLSVSAENEVAQWHTDNLIKGASVEPTDIGLNEDGSIDYKELLTTGGYTFGKFIKDQILPKSDEEKTKYIKEAAAGLSESIIRSKAIKQPEKFTQLFEDKDKSFIEASKEIISNPDLLTYMFATSGVDTASEIGAGVGGAALGAFFGSSVPVVGTTAGAVAGNAAASSAVVKSNVFKDAYRGEVETWLASTNKEPTTENIEQFRNTPELHDNAVSNAEKYSTIISGANFAAAGLSGGALTAIARMGFKLGYKPVLKSGEIAWESTVKGTVANATAGAAAGIGGDVVANKSIGKETSGAELAASVVGNAVGTIPDVGIADTARSKVSANKQSANNNITAASVISSGEGDYGSYNKGVAGDSKGKIDFSAMNVGELAKRQSLKKGDSNRIFAFGKYQIIPSTMKLAIKALGIDPQTKVTPELQERIFRDYLFKQKRPDLYNYVTGKSDDANKALLAGAQEWASIEDPRTGKSYYDNDSGGNSASVTSAEFKRGLDASRERYKAAIAEGKTPDEAYNLAMTEGISVDSSPQLPPRPKEDSNNPKYTLADNVEQAQERAHQRIVLEDPAQFKQQFEADTDGKVKDEDITSAIDVFQESRNNGDDLTTAYGKVADVLPDSDFKDRITGLSKTVPVMDDSTVGQTGLSHRILVDVLEDTNSTFYDDFTSPTYKKQVQKAVKDGDTKLVVDVLRKEAAISGGERGKSINAMADQIVSPKPFKTDAEIRTRASSFSDADQFVATEYYTGGKQAVFDGTAESAINVLNQSHGNLLRETLGSVEKAKRVVGADKAREVADIVLTSRNSSEAAARLSEFDSPELKRVSSKIISDRESVDTDVMSPVFKERIENAVDNPDAPVNPKQTDTSHIIRPKKTQNNKRYYGMSNREKNTFRGKVTNAFKAFKRNTYSDHDLPKEISDNELVNLRDISTDRGKIAANRFDKAMKEVGLDSKKLSRDDYESLDAYVRDETPKSELSEQLVIIGDEMKATIAQGTRKLIDALEKTEQIRLELGIRKRDGEYSNLVETLKNNIGSYVNTSYSAFADAKAWRKKFPDSEMEKRAIEAARKEGVENPEQAVRDLYEKTINDSTDPFDFVFDGKSTDSNILKTKNGDIANWVKIAWGENKNARENLINTVAKQSELLEKIAIDNNTVEILSRQELLSLEPVDGFKKVNSGTMLANRFSAMQDIYVPEPIIQSLQAARNVGDYQSSFLKGLAVATTLNKMSLTAANLMSWATQGLGMLGTLWVHTPVNPVTIAKGTKLYYKLWSDARKGVTSIEREAAVRHGVTSSAMYENLTSGLDTINVSDLAKETSVSKGTAQKSVDAFKTVIRQYGAFDKYAKAMAMAGHIDVEKAHFKELIERGEISPMSDKELYAKAVESAAKITSELTPTPHLSPAFVKRLRELKTVPALIASQFATQFITTTAALPINLFNTFKYGSNATTKARKKAALSQVSRYALLAAYFMYMADDNDDDVDTNEIQNMLPGWMRGVETQYKGVDDDGNVIIGTTEYYNNVSFLSGPGEVILNQNMDAGQKIEYLKNFTTQLTTGGGLGLELINIFHDPDSWKSEHYFEDVWEKTKKTWERPIIGFAKAIIKDNDHVNDKDQALLDKLKKQKRFSPRELFRNSFNYIGGRTDIVSGKVNKRLFNSDKVTDSDVKETAALYIQEKQALLDVTWKSMKAINQIYELTKDKLTDDQIKLLFKSHSRIIKPAQFMSLFKSYRDGGEKPSLRDSGLLTLIDISKRSRFKYGNKAKDASGEKKISSNASARVDRINALIRAYGEM